MSERFDPSEVAAQPKEEGVIRVMVSIPNEGHTAVESYTNRLDNFKHLGHLEERGKILKQNPRFEFFFVTFARMFTPVAREEAGKMAIESGMDYLWMIDDDMICPDDLFEKLYRHDVDIVAPLAFTRNPPHLPVMYSSVEGYDKVTRKDYFINHTVTKYPKDKLVRCDAVGFGSVLIKTSVLKGMPEPRFKNTAGTGEDIYFCYQARKQGFKCYMDTSTKLGHLSHPVVITEEYSERVRNMIEPHFEKKNGEYNKYESLCIQGD